MHKHSEPSTLIEVLSRQTAVAREGGEGLKRCSTEGKGELAEGSPLQSQMLDDSGGRASG